MVADSKQVAEAIITISVDSREAVGALVDKALSLGGSPSSETSDIDFRYSRSFLDLDNHHWEVFFMEPSYIQ